MSGAAQVREWREEAFGRHVLYVDGRQRGVAWSVSGNRFSGVVFEGFHAGDATLGGTFDDLDSAKRAVEQNVA